MAVKQPLTIGILGSKDGTPVVLDRVIGGSVFLGGGKADRSTLAFSCRSGNSSQVYRILSPGHDLVYGWEVDRND